MLKLCKLLKAIARWAYLRTHAREIRAANLQAMDAEQSDAWCGGAFATLLSLDLLEEDCQ